VIAASFCCLNNKLNGKLDLISVAQDGFELNTEFDTRDGIVVVNISGLVSSANTREFFVGFLINMLCKIFFILEIKLIGVSSINSDFPNSIVVLLFWVAFKKPEKVITPKIITATIGAKKVLNGGTRKKPKIKPAIIPVPTAKTVHLVKSRTNPNK
jgi:hypothetical protein